MAIKAAELDALGFCADDRSMPPLPRSLLVFTAAALLAAALFSQLNGLHPAFAVVLVLACAPILSRLFSPLVMGAFTVIRDAGRRSAHQQYQGNFYSYEGQQVRFYLVDSTVWMAWPDMARILEPAPTERELRLLGADFGAIPGQKIQGCTEAGILQLLKARTGHRRATRDMIQLKTWLEQVALPNVKRLPQSSSI
jgi:hypothetical protein